MDDSYQVMRYRVAPSASNAAISESPGHPHRHVAKPNGASADEAVTGSRLPAPQLCRYCQNKGLLDRLIALVLLIPSLPVIALLILVVRMTSPGPGIFRQKRVGRDGRVFTMFKLRSMRCDAEAKSGAVWCSANDSRMTRVGWWLRKLHLDELPQLFNVLRGEMAIVGPRPERPEFVDPLKKEIAGYEHRLLVTPGITGLAQLNLPPDTTTEDVRRKLVLDFEYMERGTLFLDLRIILATACRVLKFLGDGPMFLLGLRRDVGQSVWCRRLGAVPSADHRPSDTPSDEDTVTDLVGETTTAAMLAASTDRPRSVQDTSFDHSDADVAASVSRSH